MLSDISLLKENILPCLVLHGGLAIRGPSLRLKLQGICLFLGAEHTLCSLLLLHCLSSPHPPPPCPTTFLYPAKGRSFRRRKGIARDLTLHETPWRKDMDTLVPGTGRNLPIPVQVKINAEHKLRMGIVDLNHITRRNVPHPHRHVVRGRCHQ